MNKRYVIIALLAIMMFCLTACGTEQVETAVTPMNSVTEQISEVGIHAYASSLKSHYKSASREGDIGSYQFTLITDSNPVFFQSPWWVDGYNEHLTADIVVIAGHTGNSYSGTIECYKCEYFEELNEVIGEVTSSHTYTCDCDGNNSHYGMEKNLTVTVIPIP